MLTLLAVALAGGAVAVRCQTLGQAVLDGGPELGYVRWRADGTPEPRALIKRDQCRHLAADVRSDKHQPTRDEVVAVHVLTTRPCTWPAGWGSPGPSARPSSAMPTAPAC